MIVDKLSIINHFNAAFGSLNRSTHYLRIMNERLYATSYRQTKSSRQEIAQLINQIASQMIDGIAELQSFDGADALKKLYDHYSSFLQHSSHPSLTTRCVNVFSSLLICKNRSRQMRKTRMKRAENRALKQLEKAYEASLNHPWLDRVIVSKLTIDASSMAPSVCAMIRSQLPQLNQDKRERWVEDIKQEISQLPDFKEKPEAISDEQERIEDSFNQNREILMQLLDMKCFFNRKGYGNQTKSSSSRQKIVHFKSRPRSTSL